ncbi:hypothetical protein CFC21_009474 [Triticum aestivum]|uniref:SHSP domain-containing protein n=2 Tax=Triticum aestivum TaxID=4565 RepID=A0A3B5Z5N3_WHEAT|nr:hypothetical protein CFC21_009474 [Triticum aestivum]
MAATGTATRQQQPAAAVVVDPKFEWAEKAGAYVLRLTLTGFRKDDFRVQVDGAGRLTVRGTRPGASLHKVFQLPATACLDDIAGRFEAGVLTLTVPKRAGMPAAKPTPAAEVDGAKKMTGEEGAAAAKLTPQAEAPAAKKEEEVKPKAPQPAAAAPTPDNPAPKAEVANGEKAKAAVDPETTRRRGEEATAMEAKAEQAKKAVASTCTAWKERIAGELKGLADMKWADNAVETARKNKEVVAVGVAAFSIGFLVAHKLFRK